MFNSIPASGRDHRGGRAAVGGLTSANLEELGNMKIETDRATATSVLGTITGLLMIALLAAPGASYAQQASSPNSVLIEMSPKGEVLKVTKADGTPIPRVENHYARSKPGDLGMRHRQGQGVVARGE